MAAEVEEEEAEVEIPTPPVPEVSIKLQDCVQKECCSGPGRGVQVGCTQNRSGRRSAVRHTFLHHAF